MLGRLRRPARGGKEVVAAGNSRSVRVSSVSVLPNGNAKSGIAVNSGHAYRTDCMDVLTRIKRLVVARQVEFTGKAEQERLARRPQRRGRDGIHTQCERNQEGIAVPIARSTIQSRLPVRYREPELHWSLDLL